MAPAACPSATTINQDLADYRPVPIALAKW